MQEPPADFQYFWVNLETYKMIFDMQDSMINKAI